MDAKVPTFIKLDNYKNVMDILEMAKEKISEAKVMLAKIVELKREEDALIVNWTNTLEEVEEHVAQTDTALLEPER